MIKKLLLVIFVAICLCSCEVEPPEPAPTNPTKYQGPPTEQYGMSIRPTFVTTEPLVWTVDVRVEAKAIRLIQPVQFQLVTDRNTYTPYESSEPHTLQPGETMTFSASYKVGNTLEEPQSLRMFPQ